MNSNLLGLATASLNATPPLASPSPKTQAVNLFLNNDPRLIFILNVFYSNFSNSQLNIIANNKTVKYKLHNLYLNLYNIQIKGLDSNARSNINQFNSTKLQRCSTILYVYGRSNCIIQ